eukprot:m.122689 g.122689  ORF g.122689 m.122689 type:complete len:497 (+) comp16229_c0_seq1:353-1843(+)
MVFDCPVIKTLQPHEWQVSRVLFHPTLNILASASWDRTVHLYDVDEGREVRTFPRGVHKGAIITVGWHPSGGILASGSADNTTVLWDAASGRSLQTLREHFGWVMDCSFSPDRARLATASWDKTVRLWDCTTGALISTLNGHAKGVTSCRFYPVGQSSALLASTGEDARLWDTRNGKVVMTMTGIHADALLRIVWSAEGTTIAVSSADTTISVWDAKTGKMMRQLKGHGDAVKDLAFTTDPKRSESLLASAGGDSAVLWDMQANVENQLCDLRKHDEGKEVETVSISSDNTVLASGGRDGKIVLYKIPELPKEKPAPNKWRQSSVMGETRGAYQAKGFSIAAPASGSDTMPSIEEKRTSFPRAFTGEAGTLTQAGKIARPPARSADTRAQLHQAQDEAWMAALDSPEPYSSPPPKDATATKSNTATKTSTMTKNPQAHMNRMMSFMARSDSTTPAEAPAADAKAQTREKTTVEAMMEASEPRFKKDTFKRVSYSEK